MSLIKDSEAYKELQAKYAAPDFEDDIKALGKLKGWAKDRQADRAALIQALEQYKNNSDSQEEAINQLISDYRSRLIEPRPGIHKRIKGISRASLLRWRKQVAESGWASLAGEYKLREGYFSKHPEAMELLLLFSVSFPKASNRDLHKALAKELKKQGIEPPSVRMVGDALGKRIS